MTFLFELRYTLKLLSKNSGFSLLCISVLALGIAITLPVYSWVENVAFAELPFKDGARFVSFVKTSKARENAGFSRYDLYHFHYFNDNAQSFAAVGAWQSSTVLVSAGDASEVEAGMVVQAATILPHLLQSTAIAPHIGRNFSEADAEAGAAPVALIAYALWQSYFAGRDDIVGQQARIAGELRTIVGVMPAGFGFPVSQQVWLPLHLPAQSNAGAAGEDLVLTGVLKPGVSVAQANAEIALLQTQLQSAWPALYEHINASGIFPYTNFEGNGGQSGNLILLGLIVLLVAVNFSNLLVARSEERLRELAVRSALGASNARLARDLMLESLVLCAIGLLFGLLLGYGGIQLFDGMFRASNMGVVDSFWWDMSLTPGVLLFSVLSVTAIWLVSAVLPLWHLRRTDLLQLLSQAGKGMSGGSSTKASRYLVNAQLILGCTLLSGGLLYAVAMSNGEMTTLANSEQLYTAKLNLPQTQQAIQQAGQQTTRETPVAVQVILLSEIQQILQTQPGVSQVALATLLPGSGGLQQTYSSDAVAIADGAAYPSAYINAVSPGYFDTVGVSLMEGRWFGAEDSASALPVTVIDQTLATRLWPQESALGKRLQLNPFDKSEWLTVVGVVSNKAQEPLLIRGQVPTPVIYRALSQTAVTQIQLLVHATAANFDYQAVLPRAIKQVDRDLPVTGVSSVTQLEQTRRKLIYSNGYFTLAVIGFVIYLTGASTYGLAARVVSRRRIETGICMALGATQAVMLKVFLKDGFKTVAIGLSIGGVLALAIIYWMVSSATLQLDTTAVIAQVSALILLGMGTIVMCANYFPARKLVAMEPADALRYE
jgi:predicted permease